MKISEILKKNFIVDNLLATNKADALLEIVEYLEKRGIVKNKTSVHAVLMEREKLGSTGIGDNVAIPHAITGETNQITAVFGRSVQGVEFESLDQKPVHFIWLILIPTGSTGQHLQAMARISRLFKNRVFRNQILSAKSTVEIFSLLMDEDSKFI